MSSKKNGVCLTHADYQQKPWIESIYDIVFLFQYGSFSRVPILYYLFALTNRQHCCKALLIRLVDIPIQLPMHHCQSKTSCFTFVLSIVYIVSRHPLQSKTTCFIIKQGQHRAPLGQYFMQYYPEEQTDNQSIITNRVARVVLFWLFIFRCRVKQSSCT